MLTEREATNVPFLAERRVQAGDAGPAVGEFCAHPGCILPAGLADCSFRLKGAVSSWRPRRTTNKRGLKRRLAIAMREQQPRPLPRDGSTEPDNEPPVLLCTMTGSPSRAATPITSFAQVSER